MNAGKKRLSGLELLQKVRAEFFLDGAARGSRRVGRQLPQFTERCGFRGHRGPLIRHAPPLYATAQVAAGLIEDPLACQFARLLLLTAISAGHLKTCLLANWSATHIGVPHPSRFL